MKKLIFLCVCGVLAGPAWARTWTDQSGSFSIEAEFVAMTNRVVTLKKPDGNSVRVPFARLSEGDRAFVQARAKAAAALNGPGAPDRVCKAILVEIRAAYAKGKAGRSLGAILIGIGELEGLTPAEQQEIKRKAALDIPTADLAGRIQMETRRANFFDAAHSSCSQRIYPYLATLAAAPRPLDAGLRDRLATVLKETNAFLEAVFADEPEYAAIFYFALLRLSIRNASEIKDAMYRSRPPPREMFPLTTRGWRLRVHRFVRQPIVRLEGKSRRQTGISVGRTRCGSSPTNRLLRNIFGGFACSS